MDGTCDISKEEWLGQNDPPGQENRHSELNSPEADKHDVMENHTRLTCTAAADDSEEVKDREAGCIRAEQRFYKNGVIMCSFENVDRKCGHAENITSPEKGDEVARIYGHHSLAEISVREIATDENNQRCLNEDISNSHDELCISDMVDNIPNVENAEIEGQNSNILGTNSVGMNGSKNDSSLLVPLSTDENICAEINVLKMTCSSNVCPLKKEFLTRENGQQGDMEDSCINESPPLVHFTTTDNAQNSSGHSLKISESVCNNHDYLVDTEATFGNGDSLMDKETLKLVRNLKDDIDASYNDTVHPVDTDPFNDSAYPVDTDPCNDSAHPVDTDPCNDSLHPVDTDLTCNGNVHPVDTDPCNDSAHPVDTDPCNDTAHPMDTDPTCNDSAHPVDTDPCNDSLHPVDTDLTCNGNVHPVDTDPCNDSAHHVDTDPCNDTAHPMDTDPTCNDNAHPVGTDPTCNDNVRVIHNETLRQEDDGKDMGDSCISESLHLVPLTATDNAKNSACGEVQISETTSIDLDCVRDAEKGSSKQESDQQDGSQINADDSLSLDLSAGNKKTKNCSLQIIAAIDGCPSLDLSTTKETTESFSCESNVSKVTFDNNVCVAVKETSSQEIDQENCVKTSTYISKSSPLVHLDKDENVQNLATDENSIPKATFNDRVSFMENETSSLANDQQSDHCMSSSPVPLDTNKISEMLKCDASSLSKDTFCDTGLSVHEESLQKQEMLNQGISKTNSDLQSSLFISCEHSISLEKEDVNLKELDGVDTGDHKVGTDLVRENCSTDIDVDISESPVTVDKTACSESLAEDLSETLMTVNKTVHHGSVEVAISESQINLSKTVQSSTMDVPELLKTVSKTVHSDSSEEDILEPSVASTKIVQSTTIEVDVPELLQTVHSESVVEDIPELLRIISKTEPFGSIEEDKDVAVQIVDITIDSESAEENLSDSPKTFNKTAQGEDAVGDICESLKKSNKKAVSKKKKRMKEKKGHKKKSKRKLESEKIAENLRFVEVSRDVDIVEGVRMGEVVEGRSAIYNRLCAERMLVNAYEELLDQEVENQEMDGLREPGEIEFLKERKKKAKKKKKKTRRRRVATVEEGDLGDNASHQFPTYLDGFFLQYDEGNEELDETVEDAAVSFDVQASMLNSEERIYPRHFSFESEDSVKSGNCSDSVQNRYQELESRRRKKHDKREHKERKRKKARSNSCEARPEREHFMTLTARREHMFDRERNRSARDEERVKSSGRKIRRTEREMPDKDRRRVEVDEERRHSARSGSQDYRTVIAERSPAHSSQHRQRSESRGMANDLEQERGQGRAKHTDKNDAGRNSHVRGRNAENSHVENSQHRSERGSDKENNRRQRRQLMRTQQSNDLNSRDRIRNARREQVRRTNASSSSSNEGVLRRRYDDSDDDHCIIISQENTDDEGASSDVILVETERIVINLDDEEDAPPSRVNISHGARNLAVSRKANRKSVRPPSELSASLGHSIQTSNRPKRLENVRGKSKRQKLPAAPTSDRSTIEVETLSVVASSAAYDPMHPTEEADECNFTHPAFISSRIPASPVERRPVSPDSPAPKVGRPSTPPLPVVTKVGTTASSVPSQPIAGGVSSNVTSAPAFLTQAMPSHLGSEFEQASNFPSRSLRSSLSPDKQLQNGGLIPGYPAIQQRLFPTQDTVQLIPLQNSRQPLPFNTMIPPFLPPPPPPPFGVCLEANQRSPVPTLNQFSQLASTQPRLEASHLLPVSPINQFSQHASMQPSLEASQHLQVPTLNQFSQHANSQPNLEASHLEPISPVNQFSHLASMQPHVEASQHQVPTLNQFSQRESTQLNMDASHYLPLSPVNQFTQRESTQPIMQRHNIDSHRDNQDIFQPVDMVNSLHAKVSLQPALTDKSPLVGSLAADLSPSCSHSSQGHDGGDNVGNAKAVDMDFSSEDDDYHLELLSPKANRKDSKRGRQQRQHSNLNQGASSGNNCNPGSSSDLSVKHGKTVRKDTNKVASKEHLQVSQDKSKVHRGKKKRVENNVRDEDSNDDVPASAADLTCKEKFLKKLYFQERVIEEVKMAIKPFYISKKITKEQYKVILRKAVPKVCHNKKGNINPQKILHLVEAYVRKMKGQGSTRGKKRQQVQQRGVEKHSAKDKRASAAVKHNGDRTFGLVR